MNSCSATLTGSVGISVLSHRHVFVYHCNGDLFRVHPDDYIFEHLVAGNDVFFFAPVLHLLDWGPGRQLQRLHQQVTDGHFGASTGHAGNEWLHAPTAPPGRRDPSSGGRARAPLPRSTTERALRHVLAPAAARSLAILLRSVRPLRGRTRRGDTCHAGRGGAQGRCGACVLLPVGGRVQAQRRTRRELARYAGLG